MNFDASPYPEVDRPRRIALVTQGYQTAGGVQTVSRWLADSLRAAGLEVQVFDLATARNDAQSRRLTDPRTWRTRPLVIPDQTEPQLSHVGAIGVEIEPLRYLPRADLSAELSGFDLVQVVAGGPALALAAIGSECPIVLQVATTVAWERESQLAFNRTPLTFWRVCMTRAVSLMERAAMNRVDAILVENTRMAGYVRSVCQTRVLVAPPGVDTNRFSPSAEGWDPNGYLLSVCRLGDRRKGLDRLIRAYALIRAQRTDPPGLVLAGRGPVPPRLMRLVENLGLHQAVTFRPDVAEVELPSLYQGASVYLQTSYEEGLGLSVIEAMASGLPVVSTDTAGTRETVVHGMTGWVVGQDSEVEKLIAERTLSVWGHVACSMPVLARSRAVSHFSEEITLSMFLAVYEELFAVRSGFQG
jgi:glycosyltransferase involved in cell wall biosynthesis